MSPPFTENQLKLTAQLFGETIWGFEMATDFAEPGSGKHQTRQLLKMIEETIQRKRNNHHGFKEDC